METKNYVNNTKNNAFKDFYQKSLPVSEKQRVRSEICQQCAISENHFYNWLSHPEKISPSNQKVIAQAFKVPAYKLFTQTNRVMAWFNALPSSKRLMIKSIVYNNLGIKPGSFTKYLLRRCKSEALDLILSDYSNIPVNQLYEAI